MKNRTAQKNVLKLVIAALVVVALAIVGCSGKTADTGSASTDVKTVKIGVAGPLTQGVVVYGQGEIRVTELAVAEANASQEAKDLGIQFEIVEGDDQGDPKVGVNVANQLVSDPDLVGVVGHINSSVNIPASKVYNDARVVNITGSATNPTLTTQGFDNIFRTTTIDPVQGSYSAQRVIADLGAKSAFVVDNSTDYGTGLADHFAEEFVKQGGEVLGREKTAEKDIDFTALVTKIKAANPDAIYYGGLYNAGALFAKQLRDAGVDTPLISGDSFPTAEFITLAGESATANVYATSVGLPLDELPGGAAFRERFEAAYPGEEITPVDAYTYDAAVAIIRGVFAAAGEVGADKITSPAGREAIIKAVAKTDFEGLTGRVVFAENGDSLNTSVILNAIVDGVWTQYKK